MRIAELLHCKRQLLLLLPPFSLGEQRSPTARRLGFLLHSATLTHSLSLAVEFFQNVMLLEQMTRNLTLHYEIHGRFLFTT